MEKFNAHPFSDLAKDWGNIHVTFGGQLVEIDEGIKFSYDLTILSYYD